MPWAEEEINVSLVHAPVGLGSAEMTKANISQCVCVHCGVSHLYFLIDFLKHPRDDILPFHRLDLISGWPDILQKYLLALCIHSWGKHVTSETLPLTPISLSQSGLFFPGL